MCAVLTDACCPARRSSDSLPAAGSLHGLLLHAGIRCMRFDVHTSPSKHPRRPATQRASPRLHPATSVSAHQRGQHRLRHVSVPGRNSPLEAQNVTQSPHGFRGDDVRGEPEQPGTVSELPCRKLQGSPREKYSILRRRRMAVMRKKKRLKLNGVENCE